MTEEDKGLLIVVKNISCETMLDQLKGILKERFPEDFNNENMSSAYLSDQQKYLNFSEDGETSLGTLMMADDDIIEFGRGLASPDASKKPKVCDKLFGFFHHATTAPAAFSVNYQASKILNI